jgi:hypothetical protein
MYCVPGNGALISALKKTGVTLLVLEVGDHTLKNWRWASRSITSRPYLESCTVSCSLDQHS